MTSIRTKIKWRGLALSVTGFWVILALATYVMRPLHQGDAREFWAVVWGVTAPGENSKERIAGQVYTWYTPYVYYANRSDLFAIHGVTAKKVDEKELMELFPAVLDRMLHAPSDRLTTSQIAALIGEQPKSVADGLERLGQKRDQIALSLDRMQAFLRASYIAQWKDQTTRYPDSMDALISEERVVGVFLQRAKCFWLNILFEALHSLGILGLFWLPLISAHLRRFLPICWGSIPLFILTPFYFGYCEIAFTSLSPVHGGGVLYPWILQIGCRPLAALTPHWDYTLVEALPHPFSSLTQWPLGVVALSGTGLVGPTPLAVLGLVLAAILWTLPRLSRVVFQETSEAGSQPSVGSDSGKRPPQP